MVSKLFIQEKCIELQEWILLMLKFLNVLQKYEDEMVDNKTITKFSELNLQKCPRKMH